MRHLDTRPLTPERIAQAFPLIQASLPEVTLEAWRDFATSLLLHGAPSAAGIIIVQSEQGYIAGLCSYRIGPDLMHGLALSADRFTALDLVGRDAVVRALAEALESLARERRCAAVHTNLPETGARGGQGPRGLVGVLSDLGHRVETVQMCKRLASSP